MENLAYDYDPEEEETKYEIINGKAYGIPCYEIIGGEKIIMSPAPTATHGSLVMNIGTIFNIYLIKKNIDARVFGDNVDVYFSAKEHYKPDVSIVRNLEIIDWKGAIKGAPDLIVEVLSESTKSRDFGIKKNTYEKYGVKEYWIVAPNDMSIKVYHLIENKLEFYDEYKIDALSDKNEIKVSIFNDLIVDIRDVFRWWVH